jgi:hypothetical protein
MICVLASTFKTHNITIDFKVPEEVWLGKLVDYSVLNIFGCLAYVYMQSGHRSKLDQELRNCMS